MVFVATPKYEVKRKTPSTPFLGWGATAYRSARTHATSPRLLKYRSCMAGAMSGKHGTLADIQTAFRAAAHSCSGRVKEVV